MTEEHSFHYHWSKLRNRLLITVLSFYSTNHSRMLKYIYSDQSLISAGSLRLAVFCFDVGWETLLLPQETEFSYSFHWSTKQYTDIPTATESRSHERPFVLPRTDFKIVIFKGSSMRPLNLPVLYFIGGTLQPRVIARVWCLPRNINHISQLWSGSTENPKSSLRLRIFTSPLPGEKISSYN